MKPIFKQMFNCLILSCASFSALANVVLVEGHVRAMPATVPNSAAYFTLENHADNTVALVSVSTTIAKKAQLHTINEEKGMMQMREVERLDIPAHGQLSLTPMGNHIMLIGLNAPLTLGQQVTLQLTFDDGKQMDISLPVSKQADNEQAQEHHHHH